MTEVTGSHNVLGIKYLLDEFGHSEDLILLASMTGMKPGMKKWRHGKTTMLTANLQRSALSWPDKWRQVVTLLTVAEMRWFRYR